MKSVIALGVALSLTACNSSPQTPASTDSNDGFDGAVAAISLSSGIQTKTGTATGRIVFVKPDGTFETRTTSGFENNQLVLLNDGLHASEGSHELRIDAHTTARKARGADYDLGEWSGAIGNHVLNVFNVGSSSAEGTDYTFGLAAWTGRTDDPKGVILGEMKGDIQVAGACSDAAYFIVQNWGSSKSPDRRLMRAKVVGDVIKVTRVAGVVGPPARGLFFSGLFCANDTLVTYASGKNRESRGRSDHIGTIDPVTGKEAWTPVKHPLPDGSYSYEMIGSTTTEVFASVVQGGDIMAINLKNGTTRELRAIDPTGAYHQRASLRDGRLVTWQSFDDRDPRVLVIDPTTGRIEHDITVKGLEELVGDWGMGLDSDPVYLGISH